jgi:predicted nucleic acid-binding protein
LRLVVDASMAVAWCLQEEAHAGTQAVLDRVIADGGHAPAIWPTELANALLIAERRGRLRPGELERLSVLFDGMDITVDSADRHVVLTAVLPLARAHELTVYDACYLELAMRLSTGIATLDRRLTAAALKSGVAVTTG